MARPVLDVYKWNDMVDIDRLGLPDETLEAAEVIGDEGDKLLMGPNGEFVSYSCWFYSEVYDGLVRSLKGRVQPERFDVPCMGLTDADIFTVLDEVFKRRTIEPMPLDFEELKRADPKYALWILKSPRYPDVLHLCKILNLPQDRDAEIQRLEEQLELTEGKHGKRK